MIFETSMDFSVTSICDDSRDVTQGSMFFAIDGASNNGKKYIASAIDRGAKCIVSSGEQKPKWKDGVLFAYTEDPRKLLAEVAAKFYDSESLYKNSSIVAVTGTNGKSSTVDIVRQIWEHDGKRAASIGTLGAISGCCNDIGASCNLTSPGSINLHKIFKQLHDRNIDRIAIEASSHGIHQKRMHGIPFSVCAFTNFSQDHLDYHKTMENYWAAKEKLFSDLAGNETTFVVNLDEQYSEKILRIAKVRGIRSLGYGFANTSDAKILNINIDNNEQQIDLSFFGEKFSFLLPLFGTFQVYNSICAALIAHAIGAKTKKIIDAMKNLKPISGRLEMISEFNGAKIYLDYAHTPDALKHAILSARNYCRNKVITVFGCGGGRDEEKRAEMGAIVHEYSDVAVVTDDNPRNEDPSKIRKMILQKCSDAIEIADRKLAIEAAVDMLSDGDVLLLAGKGHENYQITNSGIIDFSDRDIVLQKVRK